jgi:hypothetical protein
VQDRIISTLLRTFFWDNHFSWTFREALQSSGFAEEAFESVENFGGKWLGTDFGLKILT